MKIVYASPHFPPNHIGGTERVVERLASRFYSKGHSVDVVAVETINRKSDEILCQTENWGGINVHRLSLPENNANDKFTWTYRHPLLKEWFQDYLNRSQPDLLHFHSGYLISASILEAAQSQNLPTVVTLHDFWFICPQITLLRSNGDLCEKPVPSSRCDWCLLSEKRRYRVSDQVLKGVPGDVFSAVANNQMFAKAFGIRARTQDINVRRSYLKMILEEVDLVTSPSAFLRQKFLDYGIQPKKFIHLPNGLELNPQIPAPSSKENKDGPFKIGYMGQIAHFKGVHILLEAYKYLKRTTRNLELHLYGDGNRWPHYLSTLKRIASYYPSIKFEGTYNSHELNNVIDNLDVVVVPSICYENRPTVILEAFSRGKPVIASDLGGMAELVTHNVNGLLFRAGDARSLGKQLQRVVDDPGILTQLSAGIPPVLPVDEEIDALQNLYADLVEQRHRKSIKLT